MKFEIEFGADIEDIDQLGHVSNLSYLKWVIAAAEAHSDARGYDAAMYRRLGHVFVVRRHQVDYLVSAMQGDRVRATTWVESFRGASCERDTLLTRARDGALLCRARTTWAYVSLATGRPARMPEVLLSAFRPPALMTTATAPLL